jgi:hypothetical protein
MMYVVEIANTQGAVASKEYEAQSLGDVQHMAELDMWDYPDLHIVKIVPMIGNWHQQRPAW